jgi:hypothetical protein
MVRRELDGLREGDAMAQRRSRLDEGERRAGALLVSAGDQDELILPKRDLNGPPGLPAAVPDQD